MPKFRIFHKDLSTGKRTFLGTACAPTLSEALEMAAQFFAEDQANLVAVERSWVWTMLTLASRAIIKETA